jgi:hypothetical protein
MHAKVDHDRPVKATYSLTPADKSLVAELAARLHLSPSAVVARAVHLLAEEDASGYRVRPIAPEGTDPSQAWFWTPKWQAKEQEADAALLVGDFTRVESDEALLALFPAPDDE